VIFSRLQNIGIPTDFNGVYLNLDTGVVAFPTFGSAPTGTSTHFSAALA
jgi:hypothetical protein